MRRGRLADGQGLTGAYILAGAAREPGAVERASSSIEVAAERAVPRGAFEMRRCMRTTGIDATRHIASRVLSEVEEDRLRAA